MTTHESGRKLSILDRDVFLSLLSIAKATPGQAHSVSLVGLAEIVGIAIGDHDRMLSSLKRLQQTRVEIQGEGSQFRGPLIEQLEVRADDTVTFTLARVAGVMGA